MYKKRVTIRNSSGLHARPATIFVKCASKFDSSITIRNINMEESDGANAKRIIKLLTLGLEEGAEVELAAEGPDEEAAVNELVKLIESGFNEV